MYLPSIQQIREIDTFTIEYEGIKSTDLMERAALSCTKYILKNFDKETKVYLFCGPGNNGGDGFAMARQLFFAKYNITLYYDNNAKMSHDADYNFTLLKQYAPETIHIFDPNKINVIPENSIIIDALFGTGLSKPIAGIYAQMIDVINNSNATTLSVDMPSGIQNDSTPLEDSKIVNANITLSFEFYKKNFLLPENEPYVGKIEILPIGLKSNEYFANKQADNFVITTKAASKILKKPSLHTHKGDNGRALLIVGSKEMSGAAVLATKACLKSGIGIAHVAVPESIRTVLQISCPEAIVHTYHDDEIIDWKILTSNKINSIAIGSGWGKSENNKQILVEIFEQTNIQLILDADALNIMAENPELLVKLPQNSILTPHPIEFERLTNKKGNREQQWEILREFSKKHGCYCILKGAYTAIGTPDGKLYFNTSGNSGMATGGSGDVLCGIIAALCAQNYNPLNATILGVYLHGLAADIAINNDESKESLTPSDIIAYLGKGFKEIKEQ